MHLAFILSAGPSAAGRAGAGPPQRLAVLLARSPANQELAYPTRIAILELLRDGELSAGAMQERLGIEQANLSQHLTVLRSREAEVDKMLQEQAGDSAPPG
ncbi:MAG TPA: helix-turn-helix domain-containing protein [Bryobacteraceae bacterium]|nr:helix-turn-helix domain-containing protein [Bryobacteraceae bacterium]